MATEVQSGTMLARGFDWDSVRFRRRRIGDVASLNYGKSLLEATRRPGPVPVYGTNGPCGYHDTPLSKGPGVVLGRKGQGHLGVKWVDKPFWVIDTAYFASVKEDEVDLRWFYFITNYVGLDHLKTGEKPGLNRDTFGRQIFPFPELDEQRAIARVLGALDDKIETNQRMNRTLEELAAALFRSWFVDFDPMVAKAAGRKPAHLRPDLAALFPAHWQDSVLGDIPQGWEVKPIGDVVKVVGGSTPSTNGPKFWNGNIAWATPRDLAALTDPVLTSTDRQITPDGLNQISSGLLPKGTVLLSSRAPIGYTAIADLPVAVNQGFIALICDSALPNFYVIEWLRENLDTIEGHANGTTFMEISKKNFRPIPAIVPPPPVIEQFVETVSPWWKQIIHNVRESRTLAALRDMLLPKLLSGELRVKSAEKLVEANV